MPNFGPRKRNMTDRVRKKLIDVALPLEAVNAASAREKSIRHGHPSAMHLWWARRPLATARAVIFAQMVDDPSSCPELFPTEAEQKTERMRLFRIIEELVLWENTNNGVVLGKAREEIWNSWRRSCADNVSHPRALELFDRDRLPAFHDPFAGGGALPLEAQRLGLEAFASDLNPVAVLISKATIEIPAMFAGSVPVNPSAREESTLANRQWKAAQGLGADVAYYGQWMRDEAEKRIGHLYPRVEVTSEMIDVRPDLKPYARQKLTAIAWIWARTVKSPNPAFAGVDVPLVSNFMLSTKIGKEAWVEPVVEGKAYRFVVRSGAPTDLKAVSGGTKLGRGNFRCLMSGTPISSDYIKAEGKAGRMGARLLAIVAEGDRGRVYLSPNPEHEAVAGNAKPTWKPEGDVPPRLTGGTCVPYGLAKWGDLFTPRQLVALTTLSNLVHEAMVLVKRDAAIAGLENGGMPLHEGGHGARAYAEAVALYLAFLVSQVSNHASSVCGWNSANAQMRSVFARQALPMVWDYAESNPFCESSGSYANLFERQVKGFEALGNSARAWAFQADVNGQAISSTRLISTDPPYYDNIAYADLSDFFYVWLRRSLRPIFPDLFATLAVPKAEELVASSYRHGGKAKAEAFFLEGMSRAMRTIAEHSHPAFPATIYYAFKQSESDSVTGTASTGWETFLDAVVRSGFAISGTWPLRTEKQGRVIGNDANALASSIVLVCRLRPPNARSATRREFVADLKDEMPEALRYMQAGNIAPVDLAQAAIGPGMAVFTRYSQVLDAQGKQVTVREALAQINEALDEVLAEQEGDFDGDSRWALVWFEEHGFAEGDYGVAETLSKAKNTAVAGLAEAGILDSKRGKVRLLTPEELPVDWDPAADPRLTAWEVVHHLIRALGSGGESAAAVLVGKLGAKAETARELAYRLYTISERKKRAAEALAYNGLIQSWPEIARLARESGNDGPTQRDLFE
jgi:putative DNA methylase